MFLRRLRYYILIFLVSLLCTWSTPGFATQSVVNAPVATSSVGTEVETEGLIRNQIDQSHALQAIGFLRRAIDLLTQILELPQQVALQSSEQSIAGLSASVSLDELLA